jgi:hypothetical protein
VTEVRAQGCGWTEIAAVLGGTAEGRCKRLARAGDRAVWQLQIEEDDLA